MMKRTILSTTMALAFITCAAQKTEDVEFPHVMLSNGATIATRFNPKANTLNVEVQNNNDDLEIVVVDNGVVVESETTIFEEDNMKMELPTNRRVVDIYARTRNEIQYMGSVKANNE